MTKAETARSGAVRRPLIRYHGGKWKLAPWIISHIPSHRIYVELFGGARPRTEVLWIKGGEKTLFD